MDGQEIREELFGCGRTLTKKFQLLELQQASGHGNAHFNTCVVMFTKAARTYDAIRLLVGKGFMQDAFILSRSIFELLVQAKYINEDPTTRSELYVLHMPVFAYKKYLQAKQLKIKWIVEGFERDPARLAELKQCYEAHRHKYPGRHWWGKAKLQAIAKQVQLLDEYVSFYWSESSFAHSASMALGSYIEIDAAQSTLLLNPAVNEEAESDFMANKSTNDFLRLALETTPAFGLVEEARKAMKKADDICKG